MVMFPRTDIIFKRLSIAIICIAGVAFAALIVSFMSSDGCSTNMAESATSPDGNWIAERIDTACGGNDGTTDFSIRRRDDPHQHFIFRNSQYVIQLPLSFPEWTSNSSLVIALPEGTLPRDKPVPPNGITVNLVAYPIDPDATTNDNSKKLEMDGHFQANGSPLSYPEDATVCGLGLSMDGDTYIPGLNISIFALHRIFGPYKGESPEIDDRRSVEMGFSVSSHGIAISRLRLTSAKFDSVFPSAPDFGPGGASKEMSNGVPSFIPTEVSYRGYGLSNLQDIFDKLESGNFRVTLGFWPDRLTLVYNNKAPLPADKIAAFKGCVNQLNLFNGSQIK